VNILTSEKDQRHFNHNVTCLSYAHNCIPNKHRREERKKDDIEEMRESWDKRDDIY